MAGQFLRQLWEAINKRKSNAVCIIIALAVYFLNQLFFKKFFTGWIGYFCKCFLNDLVCTLFFLAYVQIVLIWARQEINNYAFILMIGMVAGLIWEYFAPIINPRAVTDIYDLICYFCGIHIYYLISVIERKRI